MHAFRPCAIVPTYENPATIRTVIEGLRRDVADIFVVDDGCCSSTRAILDAIAAEGLARVVHRDINGGKGAAVKTGFEHATQLGFTHALQVDADAQHDLGDVPTFLSLGASHPEALILGQPIFDRSAPLGRRTGRQITIFWTRLEGGAQIGDPMCGFRLYPLASAWSACADTGDRMDFDPEIVVHMVWAGVPVLHVPTRVRYSPFGVSHFHLWRDNWRISKMHTRLMWKRVRSILFGRSLTLPSEGSQHR